METLANKLLNIVWRVMPQWQQEYYVALIEKIDLTVRDSKYDKITNALFLASYFNPIRRLFPGRPIGIAPALNIAYHFCRKIDDIADGDQDLPKEYNDFSDLTTKLKNAMRSNMYISSDLEILLRGTVRDMLDYHGFDVRNDLNKFLDAMGYENERRLNKRISSRKQLYELYQNSFGIPQDISFIGIGSKVRSVNIPELAEVQGRTYAVRDLDQDLSKGIIFIPKEIVPSIVDVNYLCKDPHSIPEIKRWMNDELIEVKRLTNILRDKKLDRRGRIIVNFLTRGIEKYCNKRKMKLD